MTNQVGAPDKAEEKNLVVPEKQLLRDLQDRLRLLDRDVACEASTVRRVLAELDAKGPSEAGDVIHSLLWLSLLNAERANRFAKELCAQKWGGENAKAPVPKAKARMEPGLGTPFEPGALFSPKAGDRFLANADQNPRNYLYCEVKEKRSGGKAYCQVVNGGWYLEFNNKGEGRYPEDPRIARVRLLLPQKLQGVRSMDDYERVIAVGDQQLRGVAAAE